MAKYEEHFTGGFDTFLQREVRVMRGSISNTYETTSNFTAGDVRCAVRIYERFRLVGSSRLSLNITLVGRGNDLFLSAITVGISWARDESRLIDNIRDLVQDFKET